MREMKDSGVEWIGKIPADWSMIRVKHAFIRKTKRQCGKSRLFFRLQEVVCV